MRIDELFQSQVMNLSGLEGVLEKANVGDIIRAKIIEIASDELILKLFDGSTINAATASGTENIDARKGEYVNFRIKDKQGNKILLEPVKNNEFKTAVKVDDFAGQINSLGITADEKKLEIAKELKLNNLQLTKENFENIIVALDKFKDTSVAKAVFLLANKLGIEEKNVSALKQFVDEKIKITQSLNNLMNELDAIKDESVLKGIANELLKNDSLTNQKVNTNTTTQNLMKSNSTMVINSENEKILSEIKILLDNSFNKVTDNNIPSIKLSQDEINTLNKIKSFLDRNKNNSENISENFADIIIKNLGSEEKTNQLQQSVLQDSVDKIVKLLKGINKNRNDIFTGKEDSAGKADSPAWDQDPKRLIKTMFDKLHVNIDSDSLKEDLNVKKMYKELYSRLDIVKDAIESTNIPNKVEIIRNIDNMESNIRFMNQLGSYNSYVQIPLKIWDRNTTGELYVLKRGTKRRKIDPENTTMFISLNTENLGKVDTFIGVNKKNININMRVEDNRIIEFIKEHHKELYERLKEKGYKLVDLKFRIPEEDVDITNIEKVAEKELKMGIVSIDYRL